MKKITFGIFLGILFGCLTTYAATTYYYAANEVSYTPSDSTWNVTTVKAALDNLKSTSGSALTNLKNTDIAKAVSANGSTLSSVISALSGIANKGSLTQTINPGGSVSISAGYYSGGKITANANQNSGTYTPSSHGTALDMGANNTYRYVNTTNVWNQAWNAGVAAADARADSNTYNWQHGYNTGYSAGKGSLSFSSASNGSLVVGSYYVVILTSTSGGSLSFPSFNGGGTVITNNAFEATDGWGHNCAVRVVSFLATSSTISVSYPSGQGGNRIFILKCN